MSIPDTNQDLEVLDPSGKKVSIGGKEFVVKPFVLRNRIKFVKIVSQVITSLGTSINEEIKAAPMKSIPILIEVAGERLVEVYQLVLGAESEWLQDNMTVKNEVEVLSAIFEVNDIPFIVRRVQELLPKTVKQG